MLQNYILKGSFRKIFFVIFVLVLLRVKAFFNPPPLPSFSDFPIQQWLLGPLLNSRYAAFVLNLFIIMGLAFGFNYALRFYRYVPFRSYAGALIFVLLFSHAPWLLTLHPLLLPLIFLSLSLIFTFRMSNAKENYVQLYWAAFFTGLAALCFPLTGVFILYIILAIAVNSILGWREIAVTMIGFFNPIILLWGGIYIFDLPLHSPWQQLFAEMHFPMLRTFPPLEWAFTGLTFMLSLWVFFSVANLAGKKTLLFRKYTWLQIWFLSISFISSFWAGPNMVYYLALVSLPISSFMAVYFSQEKRTLKSEILLVLLFVLAVIQNNFFA